MDTCSLLRVATWLATIIELSFAQIYSSIPLHVFTVPSEYPWSAGIRAPETPISRKLISYPSDILVQSNTIYYPPNSNSLPRNYFLPNPIPGKSPIIFRPTSLHRHSIPIRYEFSRVGNSLKTEGDSISKDSRRTGFVLDNSLSQSLGIQPSEPVRFWESKTVPVKPFPFSVFDGDRPNQQSSEKTSEKVESPTTTKPEVAKLEPEAEATGTPAEVTTLSEATGLGRKEPTQFYKKEKNGRVIFGFSTEDQTRMESRDADAKVYGAYTYFDPTGNPVRMQYWDEGKGFHTAGNRLPQNVANLPQAVTDTPEVQAARELHFKLYEQTLAHLKELQNLRPPADNGIYGGVSPGTIPPSKPTVPPTVSEEDDDEVIIDSQKLPDYFPSAISSNAAKEGKDLDLTSPTEGSEPSPTPNSESQSDPETVVIENPHIRSISKRSIDEGKQSRTERKMARHNAVFFDHSFPGNHPAFTTSQFPLFPAYSVLPATRVFTTPTQFRPSPPEQAHPLPGKFAPSVTTEAFKDSTSQTSPSVVEHAVKLPGSPFSDVAHRFEDLLFSKTPISAPSSDAFSNDEFTRVYLENSDELPASVGYPDEPHPWLTAPSAPEAYREEIPSAVHNTHPKLDFSAPPNSFSGFPPSKFDPQEILAPDFHIKDGQKKGSHLYGSNPLFSSFSLPSLYPQSSQSIIRTDRPYDFKYHGSGPFQIFQKAPLPSVSYHVSHFDDDTSHFNFPSGTSQLSFSRPFIGHDYTLVDKNFPSSNSHLFFSSPFVPTVEFPPTHLSGEQVDSNQGLPGLGNSADKKPSSESKGENSGSKSDTENTSKPAASSTTDGQVEQTTTAQEKESSGIKIVVPDAPAIDVRNEFPDDANNSQSETSNAVKSTEKPDAFTSVESTEANESGESTEPNSVDVSSSSEGEKSDSSLVVDGRLTAEESTAVVESITEISTEAATEKTGSDGENTGSEVEKTENEVKKIVSEGKPEIEAEKTESGSEKLVSEPVNLGTEMKSPFEISESNLVRRDAAMYSVSQAAQMRRAVPVAAVHDAQASPKQRQSLENHQKMPVYVTTD